MTIPTRPVLILVAGAIVGVLAGMFGLFAPRSVADCLLEKLKPGLAAEAVALIRGACLARYGEHAPARTNPARRLSPAEVANVTGRGAPTYGGTGWDGNLYNGNSSIILTEVDISVRETFGTRIEAKTYRVGSLAIPPLASGHVQFTIVSPSPMATMEWEVLSAKGVAADQ